MDALDTIKVKRLEYQAELEKLEAQAQGFRGAIAACDDILATLEPKPESEQTNE